MSFIPWVLIICRHYLGAGCTPVKSGVIDTLLYSSISSQWCYFNSASFSSVLNIPVLDKAYRFEVTLVAITCSSKAINFFTF